MFISYTSGTVKSSIKKRESKERKYAERETSEHNVKVTIATMSMRILR
jgi:head-tail adaptor